MKKKKLNKYIINNLNRLILRSYSVSKYEITDKHSALNNKNN